MEQKIQKILRDLYKIDGTLRQHDGELHEIVARLIASRPDAVLDQRFHDALRQTIAQALRARSSPAVASTRQTNYFLTYMKKALYALIPASVGALAVLLAVVYGGKMKILSPTAPGAASPVFEQHQSIIARGNEAFGKLVASNSVSQAEQSGTSVGKAVGLGGGGSAPMAVSADSGKRSSMVAPVPGFAPEWTAYHYVYQGDPLMLADDTVEVLRRTKGAGNGAAVAAVLQGMNFGVADLKSFTSLQVQSFSLREDKEYGYTVDVNIPEGTVGIGQNYERWPYPKCSDEACYQNSRLKESDMLSDTAAIQIADTFVREHNLAQSDYGTPEIVDDWRVLYAQTTVKTDFYFPEAVNVLYPLTVNGKPVYDDSGRKVGMNITVDVRFKRVSGAYNIATQTYESSSYAAEKNADAILKILGQGGQYAGYDAQAPKIVDVTVGAPQTAYLKMWQYNEKGSNELLVPALVFPIAKSPEPYFWRKAVVIPLASELLQQTNSGGPIRTLEKSVPSVVVPPSQ
ncbi:MAG: hypothetical protein PHI63_00820 [Patescibacteria group bacterium]|nr:hypothetical protein [Patescibacteria group bacterium]